MTPAELRALPVGAAVVAVRPDFASRCCGVRKGTRGVVNGEPLVGVFARSVRWEGLNFDLGMYPEEMEAAP